MIAAFDPSITHFGWVILDETKSGRESVLKAGVFKTEPSGGLLVQRLIMQRERVRWLLEQEKITFIATEAPYWGDFSTELLFALNQFLHEVYMNQKAYVVYIQPTTLKKITYPELKVDEVTKHHMTHRAKEELNRQGKRFSEHVADAYFVGKLGLRYYQWLFLKQIPDVDLTEAEQDLFCGKHTYVRGEKKGITEYTGIIYRENDQFFDYRAKKDTQTIIKELCYAGKDQAINDSRIL